MSSLLASLKQKAVELSAKAFINAKIKRFGGVKQLDILSQEGRMRVELELKGEAAPVLIEIGSYQVLQETEGSFLVLSEIRASKEWLGTVLNEYVAGQKLPIPKAVGAAL